MTKNNIHGAKLTKQPYGWRLTLYTNQLNRPQTYHLDPINAKLLAELIYAEILGHLPPRPQRNHHINAPAPSSPPSHPSGADDMPSA